MLRPEKGERHTPFFNGSRPQFFFRTADVNGTVLLTDGGEMVMRGEPDGGGSPLGLPPNPSDPRVM